MELDEEAENEKQKHFKSIHTTSRIIIVYNSDKPASYSLKIWYCKTIDIALHKNLNLKFSTSPMSVNLIYD